MCCTRLAGNTGRKNDAKNRHLRPTLTAEIDSVVWGTPANINGFRVLPSYCSDVAHRRPTKLCTMFGRLLGWYNIYTFSEALAPDGILTGAIFTLRPSLSFFNICSVTARHFSSGHEPSFAAWHKEWNYGILLRRAPLMFGWAAITLGIGPHSSCY